MRAVLIFCHICLSLCFSLATPLKSVTNATWNALFPIFEFRNFTYAYLGEVTKFQFNCRLGAVLKNLVAGGIRPPPVLSIRIKFKATSHSKIFDIPVHEDQIMPTGKRAISWQNTLIFVDRTHRKP